ncbi:hypothetical protein HUT13_01075 [Streptomyces harbinensis]|uniref:hypothetical protein n=1 Tax=Streptomyces harbinensis TaxID=1176198 RepID=UPI0015923D24|nr:hypothetical protein [Streptomyces harbinensis]QKV67514.1 hypothetical protein HUT13_01075 [Streptomyces harbinensis]
MTAPTPLAWLHVDGFAAWVTREGTCSMCQAENVPVVWAGSVVAYGRAKSVLACASCLRRLADFVRGEAEGPCGPTRHGTGTAQHRPAPPAASPPDPLGRAYAIALLGLGALVAGLAKTWWTGH